MSSPDWWFLTIGAVMSILALIGPRAGINAYSSGRPGSRMSRPFTIPDRILTFLIGVAFILLGLFVNSK